MMIKIMLILWVLSLASLVALKVWASSRSNSDKVRIALGDYSKVETAFLFGLGCLWMLTFAFTVIALITIIVRA